MSKTILCSVLGLTGALAAFGGQACSSSTSTANSSPDAGATIEDSGAKTFPADTGPGTTPDTGTTADTGTVTPPADAGPWTPSNFTLAQLSSLTPTALDMAWGCTVSTDDGTWNCNTSSTFATPPSTTVTLAGAAGNAIVWDLTSLTIEAGQTLTVTGKKPAIFYVSGPVLINGNIVTTAGPLTGGVGAGAPGDDSGGTPIAGGGGGSYCGVGGAGMSLGDGAAAGAGGASYGSATLVPLLAGSHGGASNNFPGGDGGGAIQITSGTSITVVAGGSILAGGLGGGQAAENGGGGGSGGAILLEAPSVAVAGNLSANGGGGADLSSPGKDATINASPALGGGNGGQGSASSVTAGGPGSTPGAAGGGGAGYIRINSTNPSLSSAIITPSLGDGGSGCASVGPL